MHDVGNEMGREIRKVRTQHQPENRIHTNRRLLMKKLFVYGIVASVFFVGLGEIFDSVGAKFKSDAKALEIISKARQAIGGDAAIAGVRSIVIKGQTTHTLRMNGTERVEQGETEIAFQLPNQMMKMVKIGKGDGTEGSAIKSHDVIVIGKGDGTVIEGNDGELTTSDGKKVIVRKMQGSDATFKSADGKTFDIKIAPGSGEVSETVTADGKELKIMRNASAEAHSGARQNELLRTTLSLLVSAPEGMDVSYTFVTEGNIDGVAVNTVDASFAGATYRLHFDRTSNFPVGMSYKGHAPVEGNKKVMVFTKTIDASEQAENFVRFGDYRSMNGVQLPYKWTISVAGQVTEVFDVVSYEVNPANIADRFSGQTVKVRMAKPVQN